MATRQRSGRAHRHPTPRDYVKVAVVLAVVTAMEVGLFYVNIGALTTPTLLALMVLKFALVALWFMHLRFDTRFLGQMFVAGIVLAVSLYAVVLWTFRAA
ncbi:MAG: cytochrome C oxidase subunit IV family protein [Actinomycetota bacterium]|nr:cytochrome C oxidase subunit IV family protein [Actinomycetota bacterium]